MNYSQGWSLIKEVKRTHNKKNVVLMFLIVMLSFAIVSEVSAVSLDDAEPDESVLDVKIHSADSMIPGERLIEVSHGPAEDANDISHSNNNQTLFKDVYNKTQGNKNLYEHDPAFDASQGHFCPVVIVNATIHFETPEVDCHNDLCDDTTHLVSGVLSKMIALYNVSQSIGISKSKALDGHCDVGKYGGFIQCDMDLEFNGQFISSYVKHLRII